MLEYYLSRNYKFKACTKVDFTYIQYLDNQFKLADDSEDMDNIY